MTVNSWFSRTGDPNRILYKKGNCGGKQKLTKYRGMTVRRKRQKNRKAKVMKAGGEKKEDETSEGARRLQAFTSL